MVTSRRSSSLAWALGVTALLAGALATTATPAAAQSLAVAKDSPAVSLTDSAAVVATIDRLHASLEAGDSAQVLGLLADDVVVLESGGFEDRGEFRSHHLPADIAFARAVQSERTLRSVRVEGDAAWVASTSVTRGEFRGRQVNSAGAELMVLRRTTDGWRITAIHWSSRARRG
jgi:ketosteroid isomerase-like protein